MTEQEMKKTRVAGLELTPCRRHLRQGPDSADAAAKYEVKAVLKEDSTSCYICMARAAALDRIKAAGGNIVKAAEDSESRAHGEICIVKRVGTASEKDNLVGIMKQTGDVPDVYIKRLLTRSPLKPLRPLPEHYFESSRRRFSLLASATEELASFDEMDKFFEKGCATMEVQVDYCY